MNFWKHFHTFIKYSVSSFLNFHCFHSTSRVKVDVVIKNTSRSRWCAGNHRGLMLNWQKNKFRGVHLGFLAAILDWQWGIFNPVFYSWYRSFVPILVILRSIFNQGHNLKEKQAYKKKSGHFRSKIFPLNFCLWPVYLCAKRISFLSPFVFA